MQKHTLETQSELALETAQRHVLRTDNDLLHCLEERLKANKAQSRQGLRQQWAIALVLGLAVGIAAWRGSAWALLPSALLIILWLSSRTFHRVSHRTRSALENAMAAMQRKDYQHHDLVEGFKGWQGDLCPLTMDQHYYAESISDKVGAHPVLGPVWARWLLEDAPIREGDLRFLQKAIDAERDLQKWRDEKENGLTGQEQFRALALERLPADVVSQARAAHLGNALPEPALAPPERQRF